MSGELELAGAMGPGPGPCPAMGGAWGRPAVTYRLSGKRKRDLLLLAARSPVPLSPTSAIDHAIAAALAAAEPRGPGALPDAGSVAEELGHMSALAERRAGEHRAALADIARHVKDLRDVMSAAAAGAGGGADVEEGIVDMRAWLDAEARPLPKPSFLATALWQAKARLDDGHVSIDLLVERVAAPELGGQAARGLPAMARLSPVDARGPFSSLDATGPAYLMCQATAAGWTISLHPMGADETPGDSIGLARL